MTTFLICSSHHFQCRVFSHGTNSACTNAVIPGIQSHSGLKNWQEFAFLAQKKLDKKGIRKTVQRPPNIENFFCSIFFFCLTHLLKKPVSDLSLEDVFALMLVTPPPRRNNCPEGNAFFNYTEILLRNKWKQEIKNILCVKGATKQTTTLLTLKELALGNSSVPTIEAVFQQTHKEHWKTFQISRFSDVVQTGVMSHGPAIKA